MNPPETVIDSNLAYAIDDGLCERKCSSDVAVTALIEEGLVVFTGMLFDVATEE